jgi:hypothetical protein
LLHFATSKASAEEFAMFKEASYYVTAHFHDDKTDAITYVKAGSESSTKGSFSDDEIEALEDQWEWSNLGTIEGQRAPIQMENGGRQTPGNLLGIKVDLSIQLCATN